MTGGINDVRKVKAEFPGDIAVALSLDGFRRGNRKGVDQAKFLDDTIIGVDQRVTVELGEGMDTLKRLSLLLEGNPSCICDYIGRYIFAEEQADV